MAMRLLTRKTLREYYDQPRNAAAKVPMLTWADTVECSPWHTFVDVKQTFPATDHLVGEKMCFDIGGNKWRIIANVTFPKIDKYGNAVMGKVYIKWIGTHTEYDKL